MAEQKPLPGEAVGTSILAGAVAAVAVAIGAVVALWWLQAAFSVFEADGVRGPDDERAYYGFMGGWVAGAIAVTLVSARRVPHPKVAALAALACTLFGMYVMTTYIADMLIGSR